MPLTAAVLDANVLVPLSLTDTLLRSAEHRRYVPLWSESILDEVTKHVARLHRAGGLSAAKRRVAFMKAAFPDALVTGWEDLVNSMTNDPKDRHVLAAAVVSEADVIVTQNLRDFPQHSCHPYGIVAMTADSFLCEIWSTAPRFASIMINEQAADLRGKDADSVLKTLQSHVPDFADMVEESLN